MRRRDHTNFSGHVLISSNMMRWNCSKISILAVTAVLASELHFPILPNFHVDATSFHVLMHLEKQEMDRVQRDIISEALRDGEGVSREE